MALKQRQYPIEDLIVEAEEKEEEEAAKMAKIAKMAKRQKQAEVVKEREGNGEEEGEGDASPPPRPTRPDPKDPAECISEGAKWAAKVKGEMFGQVLEVWEFCQTIGKSLKLPQVCGKSIL